MLSTIAILAMALYVGIAWVIVKAYRRTHNTGFLIIGCAGLLSLFGGLLGRGMLGGLIRLDSTDWPVSLGWMIAFSIYAYQVIYAGLILIGLLIIGRAVNGANPRTAGTEH